MLGIKDCDRLIVASCGGGKAGAPLMEAAIQAVRRMPSDRVRRLDLFTGPYMTEKDYERLKPLSDDRIRIARFTTDFLSYLAAADLSVSMGGYNTCMNILSTGVTALVRPFSYDREQGIRAHRLADRGILRVLEDRDLHPERLAGIMAEALATERVPARDIDLDGAAYTANWLVRQMPVG